ncbi:exopolysaccharide biosynthesis protein [Amaricoccus macauensis]|uniref:exopolysaccharide biosynthesis protein n=1 Tax=Amaricoccus macauensis TaxID=57001 RepID=UPI003C7EAB84
MSETDNTMPGDTPITRTVDQIRKVADGPELRVRTIVEELGNESFGHVLLWPALIVVTPLSGIPGLSSLAGITIAIIAAQMLFGRSCLWLPDWILRRKIPQDRFRTAMEWLRKPIGVVDRFTRPRLKRIFFPPVSQMIQLCCVMCGLAMPFLEFVPMSSSILGAAVALFAISLITTDGLLAIAGLGFIGGAITLITSIVAGP